MLSKWVPQFQISTHTSHLIPVSAARPLDLSVSGGPNFPTSLRTPGGQRLRLPSLLSFAQDRAFRRPSINGCAMMLASPQPPGDTAEFSQAWRTRPSLPLAFLPCAWAVAVLWQLGRGPLCLGRAPYLINTGTKVDGQESLEPESSAAGVSCSPATVERLSLEMAGGHVAHFFQSLCLPLSSCGSPGVGEPGRGSIC